MQRTGGGADDEVALGVGLVAVGPRGVPRLLVGEQGCEVPVNSKSIRHDSFDGMAEAVSSKPPYRSPPFAASLLRD